MTDPVARRAAKRKAQQTRTLVIAVAAVCLVVAVAGAAVAARTLFAGEKDLIAAKTKLRPKLEKAGLRMVFSKDGRPVVREGLRPGETTDPYTDSIFAGNFDAPGGPQVVLFELQTARTAADASADWPPGRAAAWGRVLLVSPKAEGSLEMVAKVKALLDGW